MVYISNGNVLNNRSLWRLSIIPEFFMAIINFIILFFQTLINPDLSKKGNSSTSSYSRPGGPPPPRPPGRRFGGFGPAGNGPAAPPMGGG